MAERIEEENFELDKSFQELNGDGGLSYAFFSLLKLKFADRPLSVVTEPICKWRKSQGTIHKIMHIMAKDEFYDIDQWLNCWLWFNLTLKRDFDGLNESITNIHPSRSRNDISFHLPLSYIWRFTRSSNFLLCFKDTTTATPGIAFHLFERSRFLWQLTDKYVVCEVQGRRSIVVLRKAVRLIIHLPVQLIII